MHALIALTEYESNVGVVLLVAGSAIVVVASLALWSSRHHKRPAALDRKLPGFEGFTGDVTAHMKGIRAAHSRDRSGPRYVGVARVEPSVDVLLHHARGHR